MTFPRHDKYWVNTAKFVEDHLLNGERLIASPWFGIKFTGKISPCSSSLVEHNCQGAVIHKGMLGTINYGLLKDVVKKFKPVFANEVFVVFLTHEEMSEVDRKASNIHFFWEK